MKIVARRIAIALSAALIATTTITTTASSEDSQGQHREWQVEERRGHDASPAWAELGIAALVGIAVAAANTAQPPQAAKAAPPFRIQPAPACTTLSGYAACIGSDGDWQFVR